MSLLDRFLPGRSQKVRINKKQTAQQAKDRLKIIVSHERSSQASPRYLEQLRQELMDVVAKVVAKYVMIDEKRDVKITLNPTGSSLELNISLPEEETTTQG